MTLKTDIDALAAATGRFLAQLDAQNRRTWKAALMAGGILFDNAGFIRSNLLPANGSYKGFWNAATNTPAVTAGTGTNGDEYWVSVGGTQSITGSSEVYAPGDKIKFTSTGNKWERQAAVAAGVSAINGQSGPITLDKSWVGLGNVANLSPADMGISNDTALALAGKADKTLSLLTVDDKKAAILNLGLAWLTPELFGAPESGDATAALQAMLDAAAATNRPVLFTRGLGRQVSTLTIPAGVRVFGPMVIRGDGSLTGGQNALTGSHVVRVGEGAKVQELEVSVSGATTNFNLVRVDKTARIGKLSISTDTSVNVGGVKIPDPTNVKLGELRSTKVWRPFVFGDPNNTTDTWSGLEVGSIWVDTYVRAAAMHGSDGANVGALTAMGWSPGTVAGNDGHNGLYLTSNRNLRFGPIFVSDFGEHAVRTGGSWRSQVNLTFDEIDARYGTGSALKINPGSAEQDINGGGPALSTQRVRRVKVGRLRGVDLGQGNPTGNREVLRLKECSDISVGIIEAWADQTDYSCNSVVYPNHVERVDIGLIRATKVRKGFIEWAHGDGDGALCRGLHIGRIDGDSLWVSGAFSYYRPNAETPYEISDFTIGGGTISGPWTNLFWSGSSGVPQVQVTNAFNIDVTLNVRGAGIDCSTTFDDDEPSIRFDLLDLNTGIRWQGNPSKAVGEAVLNGGKTWKMKAGAAFEWDATAATTFGAAQGVDLSVAAMNTTNRYGAGVFFGSTDPDLGTKKRLAGIVSRAAQTFNAPTAAGTELEVWATRTNSATPEGVGRFGVEYVGATVVKGNGRLLMYQFGGERRVFGAIEADTTFSVGPTGNFATMQEAFDTLGHVPVKNGALVDLVWQAGHVPTTAITLKNGDYSSFRISHATASPGVDGNGLQRGQVVLTNAFPAATALLTGVNCRMPIWNVLVDMNGNGWRGIQVTENSSITVNPNKGVIRATGAGPEECAGLYVHASSFVARGAFFTYCRRGIWATRGASGDAEKAVLDRCVSIGLYTSRASNVAFADGKARNIVANSGLSASGVGVCSNRSRVTANTDSGQCDASGCSYGFVAENGGDLDCSGSWAKNCLVYGVMSEQGSKISAVAGTDVTTSASGAVGFHVRTGGQIARNGSTGTNSQTPNALTAAGIIFN